MKDHGEKKGWSYQPRSKEQIQKRQKMKGSGDFDKKLKDGATEFSPGQGQNRVRFGPPTWEDPQHFGYDVFIHYGVGVDNQAYVCPAKMLDKPCPICAEASKQPRRKKGEESDAPKLWPTRRVAYYVIDRKDEAAGPKIWLAAQTLDPRVTAQAETEDGETLEVDNPKRGYDFLFSRTGEGLDTKYFGEKFSRHSGPLSDDPETYKKWLRYMIKNPIPSMLNYYDADHIAKVFNGVVAAASEDEDAAPRTRKDTKRVEFDEDEPSPKKAKKEKTGKAGKKEKVKEKAKSALDDLDLGLDDDE